MPTSETHSKLVDPAQSALDPATLRADFPVLERELRSKRLVYLDNAATTQKPTCVIDAEVDYYRRYNANVHRGIHSLSEEATQAFEGTRDRVARWLGGVGREEVVFTRGTTESINMIAGAWAAKHLSPGNRIVLTQMEHHANIVPWIHFCAKRGIELEYIPITEAGELDLDSLDEVITPNTRIVSLTHMSNVLGTINPVAEIAEFAHKRGALVAVDGAQGAPHLPLNVRELGADFYSFSAHKMLGPTGVGVLWGRRELLELMDPWLFGGEMIQTVEWQRATWADLPHKLEAGTPNIAGVIAFSEALAYLEDLGMERVRAHERAWTAAALEALSAIDGLRVFGPSDPEKRGAAIAFELAGVHPHDISQLLDLEGIAVRAGHHCAQPLTKLLGCQATTRASAYVYNTLEEIEQLAEALRSARRLFG